MGREEKVGKGNNDRRRKSEHISTVCSYMWDAKEQAV
jgi:hypothetical protein